MKLHVQLLEARNLRPPDRPCQAYVRLKLGSTKCKSAIFPNSSPDPHWFEDFTFNVDDLGAELHISVWHQDRFTDLFLGRLGLCVSIVLSADRQMISSSWYSLQKRKKRSKTPVTGEIRVGFLLSGKTSSSPGTLLAYPSSDISNSSSVNSFREISYVSRTGSSDSFQSVGTANSHDETSISSAITHDAESRDSNHSSSSPSLVHRISAWLPSKVSSSFSKLDRRESDTVVATQANFEDTDVSSDEDEGLAPLSFFEDDGISVPSALEEMPAPLGGGILIFGTYAVSAKALNGILFRPGSQFLKDLAELQKTTDLVEGPWRKGELNVPKRVITYIKAATKLVKAVKATEDQMYSRADEKGFVVNVSAITPDVPYGSTFHVDLQYCIFAGADVNTGEKMSFLRVSWGLHFLSSTMMKGIIESGVRQGLQDSYKQFAQVLEKYAKPQQGLLMGTAGAQSTGPLQQLRADEDVVAPKSDWQLAKEYFCNLRVYITILSILVVLLHIYILRLYPKSGLEFWKLDFPDTLHEFITSVILGVQIEHILGTARKFFGARFYKGSDHGVKAKGNGWLLAVTLVGAQNIPACNEPGVPDPYVVFTCAGKARTSSVKLQTSNPDWEERFEFDATEEAPSTMIVEVFDFEGPFTESESVGHVEINFLKRTPEELTDLWVPLEGKNARASGSKIHLRIVLVNTKEANSAVHYIEKVEKEVGRKINRQSFMKNTSFQRLFSLPSEEFLVNDFSCSLKRKFLLQGRLFLSPRVLAFYSNIFGHKTRFILLWEDIEEIKDTSPALGSVGMLLNPTILVFTKKGRAMDAHHGAKSVDAKGRFKFQFQSFIRSKPAYRTMMVLWKYRTLSPEQRMEMIADIEQGDDGSATTHRQADESGTFLGVDEANLTEVYSTELPLSVSSMVLIYEKENLDEKITEKTGRLNYFSTPWECTGDDAVHQRRISFKLSNQISLFGTNVTCIQQKTKQEDGHALYVDEVLTLHDVPFGDNFQIRVREEMEDISSTPPASSCKVFVGVAWQKSTMFQNRISKNIFERYTKHLKDILDISVKEILDHRDETYG